MNMKGSSINQDFSYDNTKVNYYACKEHKVKTTLEKFYIFFSQKHFSIFFYCVEDLILSKITASFSVTSLSIKLFCFSLNKTIHFIMEFTS